VEGGLVVIACSAEGEEVLGGVSRGAVRRVVVFTNLCSFGDAFAVYFDFDVAV
jgi:hypothetical protein